MQSGVEQEPANLKCDLQLRFALLSKKEGQLEVDVCVPTRDRLPEWWYENLERLPANRLHVETSSPLGMARMRLIRAVETSFFVMLDDDVLISENWFDILKSKMREDIGVLSGKDFYVGLGRRTDNQFRQARLSSGERELSPGQRGLTVNLLVRTETVKDWVPSRPDLSSWEDYDLTQHVLRKSKKWIETNAYCNHYSITWRNAIKRGVWSGEGLKLMAIEGPAYWAAKVAISIPLQLFLALSKPRLFGLHVYAFWSNLWSLVGILTTRLSTKTFDRTIETVTVRLDGSLKKHNTNEI